MSESQLKLESLPEHRGHHADVEKHRVRIEGLVHQPLELAERDLMRFPQETHTEDFTCEEGWTVPDQSWSGVSVADLLAASSPRVGGAYVEFAAGDFRFTLPLEEARAAIVAIQHNGSRLSQVHGGPSRLIVPGAACFTSIKWLDRIVIRAVSRADTAQQLARERLATRRT